MLQKIHEMRELIELMRNNDPGPEDAVETVLEGLEGDLDARSAQLIQALPPRVVRSLASR